MSLQYSTTVRNAQLDALETAVGVSAVLKIYDLTAGAPANCAAAITGTVLAIVHDRYFIEQFATQIWSLEAGAVHTYAELADVPMG